MRTFIQLCTNLGARYPDAERYYLEEVVLRYGEPHRHYHDLHHILSTLAVMDDVPISRLGTEGQAAAELAVWFHDVVYDIKGHDNEGFSGELLKTCALELGLNVHVVPDAYFAVLTTKHDGPPPINLVGKLVCDADLSILGSDESVFDEYEKQVREEYSWVPDDKWLVGRTAVLESLRKREQIYHTPEFISRFEEPARANLARSLRRLERGEILKLEERK